MTRASQYRNISACTRAPKQEEEAVLLGFCLLFFLAVVLPSFMFADDCEWVIGVLCSNW